MGRKNKKNKGSALAYALVIMTIVLIILVSMIRYITSQLSFSMNRAEREEAFQVAEAGIYYYRWYLAHQTSGRTAQQVKDFWQGGTAYGVDAPYEDDFKDSEGNKIGRYKIEVEPPDLSSTIIIVKSTGWTYRMPDTKRTVQVRFRRPSWSEYMFLTHDFINFGTESEVYGKVYSSTGVRFDGIAHNVVSSLVPSFNDPTHGGSALDFGVHTHKSPADPTAPTYPWASGTVPNRPDVFMGGREFPVPEIDFNSATADLGNMKSEAMKPSGATVNNCTSTGCYFDSAGEGRRIILKTNGTFDICTVDTHHHTAFSISKYKKNVGTGTCSSCSGDCVKNYAIPNSGIIFVENDAWVDGTVNNKKVTIAAANLLGGTYANIYIGLGNLRYSSYDCNNIIGLVAQKDITIVRDCPNNFTIDAALLAQTGRVGMNDYGFTNTSLTINGAIASYLQPYFNHGVSGFADRTYNFNNNLLYCPPAYFPTGSEYAVDLWEEL
jgi:hypothetical protein